MEEKRIPLGIEDFVKMREDSFYYIDKTALIGRLLSKQFEVTLLTRPRRFGKTLTMSMLEDFFDINRDSRAHFAGLAIAKEEELCRQWQNQYPVVFLSMKRAEGLNFESAYERLQSLISDWCIRYAFLADSSKVDSSDKETFERLKFRKANAQEVAGSFVLLMRMMGMHYGKQVILLIDEYDVPLAKASENGYYTQMMDLVRALLGDALKTNTYLKFAVVTGCLRISKESIFTGLNNIVVDDITGGGYCECIGFTPEEVETLLSDMGFSDYAGEVKQWYDGYRFGDAELYCPWSVLNHIYALQVNPKARPKNYWANTSHNGIIYRFISRKDLYVNDKFETLLGGGTIVTPVEVNLTYDTIRSTEENLWSLLYLTGYLTAAEQEKSLDGEMMALRIPNEEVKSIFKSSVVEWFRESVQAEDRVELFRALWNGEVKRAQELLSDLLFHSISYYDYRESYYHAFLTGIFAGAGYGVESNYEYGTGRPDVVVKDKRSRSAIVMEAKYAKTESEISEKCREAQQQFYDRDYLAGIDDDYTTKIGYTVVFYKKRCVLTKI